MKLFLSSLASATLDLVLPLLPDEPKNLKVAFIPTAADPYIGQDMSWMEGDRNKLLQMGFKVTDYDLKGKNSAQLRTDLSKYQVIFVGGGNTYYLLSEMRKSGFDIVIKELLNCSAVYVGSSAGSCVACQTIDHIELVEHKEVVPDLSKFDGLGFTARLILPHYGRSKYADRHGDILALKKYGARVLPLRDDQALMIDGDQSTVLTLQGDSSQGD